MEKDGLYYKYRVFREPEDVESHPVVMTAYYRKPGVASREEAFDPETKEPIGYATEVQEFVFPLKPDSDHHARVALAAYAVSVSEENPQLAKDLLLELANYLPDEAGGNLV